MRISGQLLCAPLKQKLVDSRLLAVFITQKTELGETMKTIKAICTAAILVLAVSLPVFAGDIGTPGANAPAPETPGAPIPGSSELPNAPQISGDTSAAEWLALLWNLVYGL